MSSKIRVKFEEDEKIWKFLIEPEWKKIKDFEIYLKDIFNCEEILLIDEDGYLHPNSNISYVHCMSENNEILTLRNLGKKSNYSDKNFAKRKKLESSDSNAIDFQYTSKNKLNYLNNKFTKISTVENDDENIEENNNSDSGIQSEKLKKRKRRKKKFDQEVVSESLALAKTKCTNNQKLQNGNVSNLKKSYKGSPIKSSANEIKIRHFHFDDSCETIFENSTPEKESRKIFVNCLENENTENPRAFKAKIVHLSNSITNEVPQCNSNKTSNSEIELSIPIINLNGIATLDPQTIIGPLSSDEFLNHKFEKWDSLEKNDYQEHDEHLIESSDKNEIKTIGPNLDKNEECKVIIISNEIISNGATIQQDQCLTVS